MDGLAQLFPGGPQGDRVIPWHNRRAAAESETSAREFFGSRLIGRTRRRRNSRYRTRHSLRPRASATLTATTRSLALASSASRQATTTAPSSRSAARRGSRRIVTKIPHHTIHSSFVGSAANRADRLAAFVRDGDDDRSVHICLQVVIYQSAAGRILRRESLLSKIGIFTPRLISSRFPHVEQKHIVRFCRCDFLKRRRAIKYENAAAVRRDDQVIVSRVNDDVPHGHRRDVVADRNPMSAAIPRREYSKLGPAIKQGLHLRVLAHHVNITLSRQIALYRSPRLAVVGGLERPRAEVIVLVTVERYVSRPRIEVRGVDVRDPRIRRQAFDVGDHVCPGLAAVSGHLNVSVIGADPDHPGLNRRFSYREDRAMKLSRCVVDNNRPA